MMTDHIDTTAERAWLMGLRNKPLSTSDRASLMVTFSVILDALDAERARAEKAEAERDQALARLAVAYEVAAQDVEEWREEDGETTYDAIAGSIRALIPADAAEALQRGVDATWNKAVEAAAKAASIDGVTPHTPWANGYAAACRENAADILALKRGGQP